ncbi:MAG: FecR family protein [Paenibacillus sp.]|nr:FecR family protein [Paenibacillus sp.]
MEKITDHKHEIDWNILLMKIHSKPLTPAEEQLFIAWIEAAPSHREYFHRAYRQWHNPTTRPHNDFSLLSSDIISRSGIQPTETASARSHYSPIIKLLAAASVSLIITISLFIYILHTSSDTESIIADSYATSIDSIPILPGKQQARLILASGENVNLDNTSEADIQNDANGNSISVSNGNITVNEATHTLISSVTPRYNTLIIPRGGEYNLTLGDGTRIWLNAKTSLRFPEHFDYSERIVYLEGEAYFEVAKDSARRFKVITSHAEITVYGTEFNIRCYPSEQVSETTLANGSIGFEHNGQSVMLSPGQQARITDGNPEVKILNIDPAVYCSWHTGKFIFEHRSLYQILNQLSDWYDVDFIYSDPDLRHLHFTGDLERYADFSDILSLIGMTTDVSFDIHGTTVTVSRKTSDH